MNLAKRGPQLLLGLGLSLVTWALMYAYAPLSPAWTQVVEGVRASALALNRMHLGQTLTRSADFMHASRNTHTQVPLTALMWFGCYSLGTISINMLTFRECPEAAAELQSEIRLARDDLQRKGISVD